MNLLNKIFACLVVGDCEIPKAQTRRGKAQDRKPGFKAKPQENVIEAMWEAKRSGIAGK